jgi:hypothetical protein
MMPFVGVREVLTEFCEIPVDLGTLVQLPVQVLSCFDILRVIFHGEDQTL